MTSRLKALSCLAGSFVLCMGAQAVTSEAESPAASGGPYQGIVDRNVFGLKAPPPPTPPEATKPPPPNIILSGITTILGKKQALMKIAVPPKPPDTAKEQSLILTVGQREGEVEVLAIDETAGIVTVKNSGIITNLTFKENGTKTAGAPGAAAGAPLAQGLIPPPGSNPFGPGRTIPTTRFMRTSGVGASYSPGTMSAGGPGMNPTVATPTTAAGTTLPSFGTANPGYPQPNQPNPQLNSEEAAALIELNREATKHDVLAGRAAPLPSTPYTPPGAVGTIHEPTPTEQPVASEADVAPQPPSALGRHMQRR